MISSQEHLVLVPCPKLVQYDNIFAIDDLSRYENISAPKEVKKLILLLRTNNIVTMDNLITIPIQGKYKQKIVGLKPNLSTPNTY